MGSGVSRIGRNKVAIDGDEDLEDGIDDGRTGSKPPMVIDTDVSRSRRNSANGRSTPLSASSNQLVNFNGSSPLNHASTTAGSGTYVENEEGMQSSGLATTSRELSRSSRQTPNARSGSNGMYSELANADGVDDNDREMLEHTAMSLGMDFEEFLFNVLYFGDGQAPNLSAAISNAREETVALHSENNTPYKLRPASTAAIEGLKHDVLTCLGDLDDPDCAICKECFEINDQVIFLPLCQHCFHMDCLIRWIKLVSLILQSMVVLDIITVEFVN